MARSLTHPDGIVVPWNMGDENTFHFSDDAQTLCGTSPRSQHMAVKIGDVSTAASNDRALLIPVHHSKEK
ncbi:hypothetical protein [Nocardia sp. NPDC050175]|uniref:hypothetical protein n=1 Tax=Nocardia sp. NPDC050175 TaxID=3364317 RepID=UPI00379B96EB